MENSIKKFFHIPENTKVTEKTMLRHLILTVVTILACVFSMAFTAYAYYTCQVQAQKQVLQAASYYCDVTVDGTLYENVMGGSTLQLQLDAGDHTVQAERRNGSADTGFLVVKAGENLYHTQQIGKDGNQETQYVEFTLSLGAAQTVQLMPHWGTSSHYGDYDGAQYIASADTVLIGGAAVVADDPATTEPTTTEPTTTEPTTTEPTTTEPTTTEPTATEPTATEPTATEPTTTEPTATEPTATEPTATEPTTTEPVTTEPTATEPTTTEPTTTEPTATEPTATEPTATESQEVTGETQ